MPWPTDSIKPLQAQVADLRRQLAQAELALSAQVVPALGHPPESQESSSVSAEDLEALYRLAFEHSTIGIAVVDQEGRWLLVNQAFRAVFGMEPAPSAVQSLLDLVDDVDQSQLRVDLNQALGPGHGIVRRFQHRQKGQIWCRLHLSATPAQGWVASSLRVCQIEDVTEQHLAEDDGSKERHLLAEMIARAPIAIALFDSSMRYLAHSARWLIDHDRPDEVILGRNHYDVFPDLPQHWREIHRRCLAGEVLHADEDVFVHNDGRAQYLRWAVHPWRTLDGRILGLVVVVTPINDLIQARTAAIEASRLKSDFLANMSHEIRTPLNGMLGLTELLLETDLSTDQRSLATTLFANGQWLLKLINDILDFSRIESGTLTLETREFHLPTLIGEVANLLVLTAETKGLELLCDLPSHFPEWFVGDPDRIRQILLNLVGNAIKFTEVGEVRIAARLLITPPATLLDETPQILRLSVADTGVGIPPQNRESIFASFNQGDGSTSNTHGGTGLGLAISMSLAQLLGGSIDLESTVGAGSVFHVNLPLASPARVAGVFTPSLSGATILVAETNRSARDLIRTCLESRGARVIETELADAILPLLKIATADDRPTLCLVAERLVEQVPKLLNSRIEGSASGEVPIVVMATGWPKPWATTPNCQVISKPILPASLLTAVAEALRLPHQSSEVAPDPTPIRTEAVSTLTGVRVLLAEDNTTNQMVALRMLQRLGCESEVVADGLEVLSRLDEVEFDVILMDVQMPRMDGYQATSAIRHREERLPSPRHLPIIAMTAHAMQGDRERCLAARMDDYLSKPVTIAELARVLERWVRQPKSNFPMHPTAARASEPPAIPALEVARLHELSQGDDAFERELLECLLSDVATGMERLAGTLDPLDPPRVATTLHGIVGACRTVGAEALALLCREREHQALQPHFQPDSTWLATIAREHARLVVAVTTHLGA